jgi:hypothetical protein
MGDPLTALSDRLTMEVGLTSASVAADRCIAPMQARIPLLVCPAGRACSKQRHTGDRTKKGKDDAGANRV